MLECYFRNLVSKNETLVSLSFDLFQKINNYLSDNSVLMSSYEEKDFLVLELLFYSEKGLSFMQILEQGKFSRSTLFRHLPYLMNDLKYITTVSSEDKKSFFMYSPKMDSIR